ncbi:AAA family ATPase [Escherichia coli]|uniref:AAA family ATPase n=1 Tax=Escherichia coli TaxID=562 RepID=UPI002282C285|nr:AAA family ATPase [Escherichia coli]MCZ0303540.1 AAA family ATPase [Escherichia coli]MCZ0307880.1 AAA family ATPase [Escherichia coli]MCZ0336636.1 AAA family ATPase [Escherichia coli]MCZ0402982.1 AAA family ATPase [Escherichia coli]MCZ0476424.1 AAA family ATPase [Escherichia coli]
MKPFVTGLVVGKFAPLHCGHERLINTALAQCEELFIISYSVPEMPDCEPEKRLTWLQVRFPRATVLVLTPELIARYNLPAIPHNDADADIHRHYVATLCLHVLRCRPHAVFTAEDYGDGFAKVLAQRFAQPVEHVRLQRPLGDKSPSGTLIRSDVHRYRYMLAHDVYRSFVRRICLLGGESTGKSTLSKALADVLDTAYVAEFGRDYWEEKNGVLTADDLLHIAREQVSREQQAEANRYLICDTSPLTTLFYTLDQYGHAPQELHQLAERQYSLVVLCGAEFPFVQDGTRQGEAFCARQQAWYEQELSRRKIPYLSVSGSLQDRLGQILHQLPD